MAITVSKLIALLISIGYFILALVVEKPTLSQAIVIVPVLLFPVALIWFPDMGSSWYRKKTILGNYDEPVGRMGTLRDSPPGLVAMMGWFFLLGMPVIFYLLGP